MPAGVKGNCSGWTTSSSCSGSALWGGMSGFLSLEKSQSAAHAHTVPAALSRASALVIFVWIGGTIADTAIHKVAASRVIISWYGLAGVATHQRYF